MKTFALMSHNDGTMQSGDCRLFPDKASAYNAMLSDIRDELFCEENLKSDEDVRRTFERHDGNLDTDSADIEYFGVTYEWKIQECDMPEKKDSGLHLDISDDDRPKFLEPLTEKETSDDEAGDNNAASTYSSDADHLSHKIAETAQNWSAPAKPEEKQAGESDVVAMALNNLNIKWCQEDLEGILEDADIPATRENLERLCKQITDSFQGILIEEISERLQFLAFNMKAEKKKAEERKAAEKGNPCTRAWRVYGREGHRQRESFSESYTYDFSDEHNGTRIISVLNSDKTGSNDFTIIQITRNTREECAQELDGQLSDGIFENSNVGKVEEIDPADFPQSVK